MINSYQESTGGEDAHFVHRNWLGIADGVGQWSMEGKGPYIVVVINQMRYLSSIFLGASKRLNVCCICFLIGANASSYAQELLENCVEILSSTKSNHMTDPVEVIVRGAGETHSSGLSTVMMASFDGQV